MPDTKNGTPEDYAEWKRQQALELPVRDVQDSDETPEQRTQRHLNYASENETPDQRTNRFLEKARRAGYMTQSPMAPVRNGPPQEPPADLELEENNHPVNPGLTWENAGTEIPQRMADLVSKGHEATDAEKLQNELAIMRARNLVDQKAIPAAHWAKQNVPGMEALSYALTYRQRIKDAEQAKRQPVQMQREFSNEEEKARYLEKVRQAQQVASGSKK